MNKVALITGGSRGIGAATVQRFANGGYSIALTYLKNVEAAEHVRTLIESSGVRCVIGAVNIANELDVTRFFSRVMNDFGRIDTVINNAGILNLQSPLAEMQYERFRKTCQVNIVGTMLCCREAIRYMSTQYGGAGGSIVNVSSTASKTGAPFEYIDYAATKGAIDTLTKGLALEVAQHGITVNAVRPGFIHTEIHADGGEPGRVDRMAKSLPMRRGGSPAEVAQAIYWLTSEEASYVNGAIIDVAGGC